MKTLIFKAFNIQGPKAIILRSFYYDRLPLTLQKQSDQNQYKNSVNKTELGLNSSCTNNNHKCQQSIQFEFQRNDLNK